MIAEDTQKLEFMKNIHQNQINQGGLLRALEVWHLGKSSNWVRLMESQAKSQDQYNSSWTKDASKIVTLPCRLMVAYSTQQQSQKRPLVIPIFIFSIFEKI